MANFEMQLVSRIIRSGSIKEVLDWGITPEDFRVQEAKAYFKLVYEDFKNAQYSGTVWGPNVAAQRLPQLQLCDDPSTRTEFLCAHVRRNRMQVDAQSAIVKAAGALAETSGDPTELLTVLAQEVTRLLELGSVKKSDMNLSEGMDQLVHEYMLRETGQFPYRMQWPWDPLNEAAGGIEDGDYIVFYGRPKSMKTWVLCFLISWVYDQNQRALIYTKEMTSLNLYKRVAACIARIPYQELRHARLSPEHKEALMDLRRYSEDLTAENNMIVLSGSDAGPGADTVPWLQSKVEKYNPRILFVDGLYLLSDADSKKGAADHTRVMNISRALRQLAKTTGVPVIATMQATRKAAGHSDANLDEIAYSDAIAQDATIAVRCIQDKEEPIISLVFAGSREFKMHGLRINGVPGMDFTYHSMMSERDVLSAKEADTVEEEKKGKKGAAGAKKKGGTSETAKALASALGGL